MMPDELYFAVTSGYPCNGRNNGGNDSGVVMAGQDGRNRYQEQGYYA